MPSSALRTVLKGDSQGDELKIALWRICHIALQNVSKWNGLTHSRCFFESYGKR